LSLTLQVLVSQDESGNALEVIVVVAYICVISLCNEIVRINCSGVLLSQF